MKVFWKCLPKMCLRIGNITMNHLNLRKHVATEKMKWLILLGDTLIQWFLNCAPRHCKNSIAKIHMEPLQKQPSDVMLPI